METIQSPEQPKNSKTKGTYVVWTLEMDRVLTETFIYQIQKGNKSEQGWKSVVWTAGVEAIKEKCGKKVSKDNIQARLKTWTKNYNIVTEIRDQSGFGWDDTRKMIEVNNDVWENYVKSHPDAKGFRYKALTNYDELAIIIGNASAKGGGANTGSELDKSREGDGKNNNENDELDGSNEDIQGEKNGMLQKRSISTTSKEYSRKKIRTGDAIASAVTMMSETLKSMVDTNLRARLPTVDIGKLCQEVSKIPDFDQSFTLQAVDMLAGDKSKEHVFYGLPDQFKKEWLMMHLNSSNN